MIPGKISSQCDALSLLQSAVTPLSARAVSSWLAAFGVACLALLLENDIKNGVGTCSSLFAFCLLQLVVVARYATGIDWGKPMSIAYLLFITLGALITGVNLLASRPRLRPP